MIALIVGLALAFGLQPVNGLTPLGVRAIAVIVPTLILWLTVNTHWSCLLFSALLIMAGVMTPTAVWAGSMGHFAPTLVLVFTLLGQCLNATGAIDKVAAWFITRKFVSGRPYAFMGMFFFSNLFIGLFMQNLALAIIYLDLTVRVCGKLGIKKGHTLYTCLVLGVLWGNSVLTTASPIAKTLPNIMMGILHTQLGITITYGQWFAVGIPFSIAMFVVIMIVARLMKPDVSPLRDLDIDAFAKSTPPLSKSGKIALLVMCSLLMVILLPDLFLAMGLFVPISNYFVQIGPTVPAILAVVALCLIRADGQAVMDFPTAAKSVPMTLIVFIAAVILMGVPISDDGTGIVAWLGNILSPMVAGLSPVWIIIAMIAGILVVTNLISNAVTMVLFFNIGVVMLAETGTSIGAFGLLLSLATSTMACLMPSASLQLPLFYGPGHITVASSYKANLLFVFLAFLVVLAFIPIVSAVVTI
ncbi:MAG: anion permease [Oscillospiraceae bacterium]|nr:anion permease [Oscillospiraceae bacterium]